jgi:hypothetical protein
VNADQTKRRPIGSPDLALVSRESLPALRIPEVKEPFGGRRGRQLANEVRQKYFLMSHKLVLERLGIESSVVLSDYAQQVVIRAVNQMLDRYSSTDCSPAAEEFQKEFTQVCIQQLVANVRAILDNHSRAMGEFF